MPLKQVSQLVTAEGKAAATATSAHGWFIHNGTAVQDFENRQWGDTFAPVRHGNKVEFYVTGEEYFNKLATVFASAKESIYITGWQVNFDVELANGKTLFEHLESAMSANKNLHVYVMPWLSPKVQLDTGDFETMLAIFQLNAGVGGSPRAFALPAVAQSDMTGGLAIGFSHHQKLVVVDRKLAFVGGIDLAYGRRDDGRFLLRHEGRKGNELYNPCIPPMHKMTKVEQCNYLTRWELVAACLGGTLGGMGTFYWSAAMKPVAYAQDGVNAVAEQLSHANKKVIDWWNSSSIMPEFLTEWKKIAAEAAENGARKGFHEIDSKLGGKLTFLRDSASANAADAAAALIGWLNHASLDALPAEHHSAAAALMDMFVIATMNVLHQAADERPERYENLQKLRKMLPKGAVVLSSAQPRMPWHDVHSSVEGPSVSDLCRNFERRWNGVARRYEGSFRNAMSSPLVKDIFSTLKVDRIRAGKLPRIALTPGAETQAKVGNCWVQTLRSASVQLQQDEAIALKLAAPAIAEDNCLKATLNAIMGAQHFIYIEGQFFQTAYGASVPDKTSVVSGPMAALIDIRVSPDYERYKKILGLENVAAADILRKINWVKFGEVTADKRFENFKRDLMLVLKNVATIEALRALGKEQVDLLNPVGEALAKSIESAIRDDRTFHIYVVLPVHPEGTLDTLNIMTQIHLTMQSLVFGSSSILNRTRRAILARELAQELEIDMGQALKIALSYDEDLVCERVGDKWMQYLTLLNLRNWEVINGRTTTEQIYVHSKLLIADDRVAILGSANINDRSLIGTRDSELAVMIRDDSQIMVRINGLVEQPVSAIVHELRVRLWKKLFGLMGRSAPALHLAAALTRPAAPSTWQAIQKLATNNSEAYQKGFAFVAKVSGTPSSIWPTWDFANKVLGFHMPFSENFWRNKNEVNESFTWDAKSRAPESIPVGVKGFIVALPITWTESENNISGVNLSLLSDVNNLSVFKMG